MCLTIVPLISILTFIFMPRTVSVSFNCDAMPKGTIRHPVFGKIIENEFGIILHRHQHQLVSVLRLKAPKEGLSLMR